MNPDTEVTKTDTSIREGNNLQLISNGRVDTIPFGIGETVKNIIDEWGEPISIGYFMGGAYLSYDKVTFFTDKPIDDIENGKVLILGFSEGNELFNVFFASTFSRKLQNIFP